MIGKIMRSPAVEHLIRQRVSALRRALPAAKAGDVTSLHQARVATRRLRAALPLLASGPKVQKVEKSVRRLTRALGPVRELDVALMILDELEQTADVPQPAIDRLRLSIIEERRHLQAAVCEQIDAFDLDKLRKRTLAAARKHDSGVKTKNPRSVQQARQRTARRARQLTVAMESAAGLYLPDRLHEVRIAVKKLRYTLELEGGARHTSRLRALKNAQDLLGRMHDLEVLIARTRGIQSSPGASTLKVSADLDRLVRRLENECRQLHGHYMAARPTLLAICHRLTVAPKPRERARSSAA
jgi:CHAD domain-containing protein